MQIQFNEKNGVSVLALSGTLDTNSTPQLETELAKLADEETRRILVDLSDIDFISSVGLRAFLVTARKLGKFGGQLCICGPNEAVHDTFEASGFTKLFKIFATEQDAFDDQWVT